MQLILASNSPRRRQLMSLAGWTYTAIAANVDENPLPAEKPLDYVLRLAADKARVVGVCAAENDIKAIAVLAADTTVVDVQQLEDGETKQVILGKPENAVQAEDMLRSLRGRTHRVYTAMAAFRLSDGMLLADWYQTDVKMRFYTDQEMLEYIVSGDPLDKAGAYAIQHPGFHPVESIRGCYANVMGLPVCRVTRLLERLGVMPAENAALACRAMPGQDCQIAQTVLEGLL